MMDVRDWFYTVYLPTIENPNLLKEYEEIGNFRSFTSGGYELIGKNASRVTFRYFDFKSESIAQNEPYNSFYYYKRGLFRFDPKNGPLSGEYTFTFSDFINNLTNKNWRYVPPGDQASSFDAGGYVIYFGRGNETETNTIYKNWISENNTFNCMLGLIAFDSILYYQEYNYYTFCKFQFLSLPSGNIKLSPVITVIF